MPANTRMAATSAPGVLEPWRGQDALSSGRVVRIGQARRAAAVTVVALATVGLPRAPRALGEFVRPRRGARRVPLRALPQAQESVPSPRKVRGFYGLGPTGRTGTEEKDQVTGLLPRTCWSPKSHYTLKRISRTSPSTTSYSLPSRRILPSSL